ncbi:MAG: hypothetical protein EOP09_15255 [Proteobacteria bacterium]|nr:MAG: hypothetical protein EOP09_15255 [Pseudomonadota bacterium]
MKTSHSLFNTLSFILIALVTSSCVYDLKFATNTVKQGLNKSASTDAGRVRLAEAQRIMATSCATCHSSYANMTDAQWIAQGLIIAGDATNSVLLKRTRGAGTDSQANMPPGVTLSAQELDALREWINRSGESESSDPNGDGTTVVDTAGPARLAAVLQVLTTNSTATGKSCVSCHNVARTATSTDFSGQAVPLFANFTRDSEFVTSGLIQPGIAARNSWIYRVLRNHGDIGTMPKSDSTGISTADAEAIEAWIEQMAN